ncbi:iron-containing alcohol dehydrogenase [Anditalea andensis]|uniref:Alcohol dehydrogenase n=1 Tax=Anditalea andensis TaxID=1048983 RepID=A0A074KW94_9BACT|nr:iron-containing alcohol dehydrogenase [Anditalea andensis]KEO74246.1 alcohol dehydrogenase [Anditalea andensis]
MKAITLYQPEKLVFGVHALQQFKTDYIDSDKIRVYILTISPLLDILDPIVEELKQSGKEVAVEIYEAGEPSFDMYFSYLDKVRDFGADSIVGIGGGSVLDLAKLLAAMKDNTQSLDEVIGLHNLLERKTHLTCLPSTSGTGSEVSPNAIFLDEKTLEKKGVISRYLVPNAAYVDPLLTLGLPAKITAETGVDALSHCIEAYTNKFSHPLIDSYALKGIELIGQNLLKAYQNGQDQEVRSAVALGSMYGGLCLGPINTAAVHALSYPLGGKYHVPHGLANAVLLPEVMDYNMEADIEKHAQIAIALGVKKYDSLEETAKMGVEKIKELVRECAIPNNLTELGVQREDVDELAGLAMKITRLLKNNPRDLVFEDAVNIYNKLF